MEAEAASKALKDIFESRGNPFTNKAGMTIGITGRDEIWTSFVLSNADEYPLAMTIYTEDGNAPEFMTLFRLSNLQGIEELGYNDSRMRYLNGLAEMTFVYEPVEAEFTCRIYKSRTMIYSAVLHFYHEVPEHLTTPEDFLNYAKRNEEMLLKAEQQGWKW